MAVIKQLFDNTINDKIYPVTHINAVLDNNGNNIADLLEGAGSLVVNFTFDDGKEAFTADQTQSAILDAYESGKVVFGKILPSDPSSMLSPGQIFQLSRIEAHEGGYIFFSHLSELEISANLSCDWGDIYYYPSQTALAPTSSPSFAGSPTAPTPLASSNNNSIATTAFVKTALENVHVTTDAALDDTSENPVQNKVISSRIANIEKVTAEALNNLQANQNLNKTQQVTGTAAASVTIDPYKFYDFGTLSQSMTIVFNTSAEISGYTREYTIRFVAGSGCNVTLPNGVLYANNTTPTYTTGRTYEINVVNNCVVVAEFY